MRLQALQRGKSSRKLVRSKAAGARQQQQRRQQQPHEQRQQAAAVRLQALQRGKSSRKLVRSKAAGARQQQQQRRRQLPLEQRQAAAAVRLQALQRGKSSRKLVKQYRVQGVRGASQWAAKHQPKPQVSPSKAIEERQAAAAVRLQALQRGRSSRKLIRVKGSREWAARRQPRSAEEQRDFYRQQERERLQRERAATRVQALQRGRSGRNLVASQKGGAAGRRGSNAKRRPSVSSNAKRRPSVSSNAKRRPSVSSNAKRRPSVSSVSEAQRQKAATRLQSLHRGRSARALVGPRTRLSTSSPPKRKGSLGGGRAGGSPAGGKGGGKGGKGGRVAPRLVREGPDGAATRLQSVARGRSVRRLRALRQHRGAAVAAVKAGSRRGSASDTHIAAQLGIDELAQLSIDELSLATQHAAATRLQAVHRGGSRRRQLAEARAARLDRAYGRHPPIASHVASHAAAPVPPPMADAPAAAAPVASAMLEQDEATEAAEMPDVLEPAGRAAEARPAEAPAEAAPTFAAPETPPVASLVEPAVSSLVEPADVSSLVEPANELPGALPSPTSSHAPSASAAMDGLVAAAVAEDAPIALAALELDAMNSTPGQSARDAMHSLVIPPPPVAPPEPPSPVAVDAAYPNKATLQSPVAVDAADRVAPSQVGGGDATASGRAPSVAAPVPVMGTEVDGEPIEAGVARELAGDRGGRSWREVDVGVAGALGADDTRAAEEAALPDLDPVHVADDRPEHAAPDAATALDASPALAATAGSSAEALEAPAVRQEQLADDGVTVVEAAAAVDGEAATAAEVGEGGGMATSTHGVASEQLEQASKLIARLSIDELSLATQHAAATRLQAVHRGGSRRRQLLLSHQHTAAVQPALSTQPQPSAVLDGMSAAARAPAAQVEPSTAGRVDELVVAAEAAALPAVNMPPLMRSLAEPFDLVASSRRMHASHRQRVAPPAPPPAAAEPMMPMPAAAATNGGVSDSGAADVGGQLTPGTQVLLERAAHGAATHIQSCYRRHIVTKTMHALNHLSTIIQSGARGRAGRRRAYQLRRQRQLEAREARYRTHGSRMLDGSAVTLDAAALAHPLRQLLVDALDARKLRVVDLFHEWDEDESGVVSLAEFEVAIGRLGLPAGSADAASLFHALDSDADAKVSYAEMHELLRRRAPPAGGATPLQSAPAAEPPTQAVEPPTPPVEPPTPPVASDASSPDAIERAAAMVAKAQEAAAREAMAAEEATRSLDAAREAVARETAELRKQMAAEAEERARISREATQTLEELQAAAAARASGAMEAAGFELSHRLRADETSSEVTGAQVEGRAEALPPPPVPPPLLADNSVQREIQRALGVGAERAAAKIQAMARRRVVVRTLGVVRAVCIMLQSAARAQIARRRVQQHPRRAAAIRLQRIARGHATRRQLGETLHQLRCHRAAPTVRAALEVGVANARKARIGALVMKSQALTRGRRVDMLVDILEAAAERAHTDERVDAVRRHVATLRAQRAVARDSASAVDFDWRGALLQAKSRDEFEVRIEEAEKKLSGDYGGSLLLHAESTERTGLLDPAKVESAKAESAMAEPAKTELARADPTTADPTTAKAEPAPSAGTPTGHALQRKERPSLRFSMPSPEVRLESSLHSGSARRTMGTHLGGGHGAASAAKVSPASPYGGERRRSRDEPRDESALSSRKACSASWSQASSRQSTTRRARFASGPDGRVLEKTVQYEKPTHETPLVPLPRAARAGREAPAGPTDPFAIALELSVTGGARSIGNATGASLLQASPQDDSLDTSPFHDALSKRSQSGRSPRYRSSRAEPEPAYDGISPLPLPLPMPPTLRKRSRTPSHEGAAVDRQRRTTPRTAASPKGLGSPHARPWSPVPRASPHRRPPSPKPPSTSKPPRASQPPAAASVGGVPERRLPPPPPSHHIDGRIGHGRHTVGADESERTRRPPGKLKDLGGKSYSVAVDTRGRRAKSKPVGAALDWLCAKSRVELQPEEPEPEPAPLALTNKASTPSGAPTPAAPTPARTPAPTPAPSASASKPPILSKLLRQSTEGVANAAKAIGQVMADASSAATLLVDDIDRHTLHRARGPTRAAGDDGPTLLQRAPRVLARLQPPADGASAAEQRLSHSERIVKVSAEYAHMAPLSFVLDGVVGPAADQAAAYAAIGADATEGLLCGESSTIVAYGAGGTGKSYMLFGPPSLTNNPEGSSWQEWGMLPRASHHIFSRASAVGGVEGLLGKGSSISCSFLEVVDESIHDLLGRGRHLRLRESAAHGVHVPGATKRLVEWEEDVMRALVIGLQNRSEPGPSGSSAHTIFTLTVSRRLSTGGVQRASLQLVDLGAPEVSRPGAVQSRRPPAQSNASLAALISCINALGESTINSATLPSASEPNPQAIPYRDSKLTWLLRDALGGNAIAAQTNVQTTFVALCAADGEPGRLPATINSLRFANRCRQARVWMAETTLPPAEDGSPLLLEDWEGGDMTTPTRGTPAADERLSDGPYSPEPPSMATMLSSGTVAPPASPPVRGTCTPSTLSKPAKSGIGVRDSPGESMHFGAGSDSDGSFADDGESDATLAARTTHARSLPPAKMARGQGTAALLSEHSAQTTAFQERHVAMHEQVALDEAVVPIASADGWEQLQSAHAHMLLLETRLKELAGTPESTRGTAAGMPVA